MSGGTRASAAGAMTEPSFVWRSGIQTERGAKRVRSFLAAGKERPAISVGASEHFTLPRIHPGLREVNAYLGWFGDRSRAMQAIAAVNAGITRIPGMKRGLDALTGRFVSGSTGGPTESDRAGTGSVAVAIAYDASGAELSTVEVRGPQRLRPRPPRCSPGAGRTRRPTECSRPAGSDRLRPSATTPSSPAVPRSGSSGSEAPWKYPGRTRPMREEEPWQ